MTPRRLHDIAHARTGDKGDTLTLSIFAYRREDYPVLLASATVERMRAHMQGVVAGEIVRHELPLLDGVHFVCRQALKGGVSSLVSVAALYNDILARHPHLLGLYYRLWYFSHLCEPQPSLSPIFSFHEGKLSCRYLRQYTELGHEIRGLPLSRVEIEALDVFDATMQDPALRLDMMLEPGDLQFANNYAVLHSRTEFEDAADPALHRRMLRLWLKMPNARPLAPEFPGRNGFPTAAEWAEMASAR